VVLTSRRQPGGQREPVGAATTRSGDLAAAYRVQGRPHQQIAVEIAATAGITPLWAWRLAKGWCRGSLDISRSLAA